MTARTADTAAEELIRRTWESIAMAALEQFAKEGEGGWETEASPVYDTSLEATCAPALGPIRFRFVYRPAKRKIGQPRVHRFSRKAYDVVGKFGEASVVVERLVK